MDLLEYVDLSARALIAFLVPLAWAAIFYPIMRKTQKPWHILVIVASILSFSTLVLAKIIERATPMFGEIVFYAIGILFGIAALSFLFSSKSRWLETLPKGDIVFRGHKMRRRIHMRYLFQVAISVEEQGKEFYTKLADKASNVEVKNLCSRLASEEDAHKRLFQDTLSRWLPLPADREPLHLLTQELRSKGLFSDPPPPDATEEDMVTYAIEQEKKTADFYLSFEKLFPDAWKKMHIETLVREERAHANKLMASFPQYKHPSV